jgi:hypothetical protein
MNSTTIGKFDVEVEPLRGGAERGEQESVDTIARSVRAMGIADPEIEESAFGTDEASARALWSAVVRFLTNTRIEERNRERHRWRWPLFVLTCPPVPDAETQVLLDAKEDKELAWKLKLFGCGFENKTTLSVSDRILGIAAPGQTRLLFAEADVEVVDFDVVRFGKASSGRRIEIIPGNDAVGWADLPATPAWLTPANAMTSLLYRSTQVASKQQWVREESYANNFELVIGPSFDPVELGATLAYQLTTTVTLTVALPGGGDWDVCKVERCAGMTVVHK